MSAKMRIVEMDSAAKQTKFQNIKGIGEPARRALASAGFTHLEQLAEAFETDLMKLHGMGPKAIRVLKEELAKQDLSLKTPSGRDVTTHGQQTS